MLFENYCLVVPCFKGIPLSLLGLQVFVYEVGRAVFVNAWLVLVWNHGNNKETGRVNPAEWSISLL